MFSLLFNTFFGCLHRNYSFPFTVRAGKRRTGAALLTGTYVVCLSCGRELPYDWNAMRVVTRHPAETQVTAVAAPEAA
jgi:hypothetical protein